MNTKTSNTNQATPPAWEHYTTGVITSKDGTYIGYRQYGHGPSIVLVQGGMGAAHHFHQLAWHLSDTFTVYVPDRRDRGLSGPSRSNELLRAQDRCARKAGFMLVWGGE